jgi:hypothetical protein
MTLPVFQQKFAHYLFAMSAVVFTFGNNFFYLYFGHDSVRMNFLLYAVQIFKSRNRPIFGVLDGFNQPKNLTYENYIFI